MSRLVEWEGEPFALLVESPDGDYLVPPVLLEGRGRTRAVVVEIDRRMKHLSDRLGVPIGRTSL